jgi:multimeric flavodoxin WrbA
MVQIYRGLVEWCDIVVVATPIRWGSASSLYYKMQERLNALQNQITLHNRVLIKEKAACFIITGGQDGVQSVAGQLMMFFAELGFTFPQFPFIGWTRGWYNEEMKTNFTDVSKSDLVDESGKMIGRATDLIRAYRESKQPIAQTHKNHK